LANRTDIHSRESQVSPPLATSKSVDLRWRAGEQGNA